MKRRRQRCPPSICCTHFRIWTPRILLSIFTADLAQGFLHFWLLPSVLPFGLGASMVQVYGSVYMQSILQTNVNWEIAFSIGLTFVVREREIKSPHLAAEANSGATHDRARKKQKEFVRYSRMCTQSAFEYGRATRYPPMTPRKRDVYTGSLRACNCHIRFGGGTAMSIDSQLVLFRLLKSLTFPVVPLSYGFHIAIEIRDACWP